MPPSAKKLRTSAATVGRWSLASKPGLMLRFTTGVPRHFHRGSFDTERSMAVGPHRSVPCMGPMELARGVPARRPSGVAPVVLPNITCAPGAEAQKA